MMVKKNVGLRVHLGYVVRIVEKARYNYHYHCVDHKSAMKLFSTKEYSFEWRLIRIPKILILDHNLVIKLQVCQPNNKIFSGN